MRLRAGLAVPLVLFGHPALVVLLFGGVVGQRPLARVDQKIEHPVHVEDFFDSLGFGILAEELAGGAVEAGDRALEFAGYKDAVAVAHEPPGQLCGTGFEGPQVVAPVLDGLLPQDGAVKPVPRDEDPFRGKQDRNARAFVHDVVEASV